MLLSNPTAQATIDPQRGGRLASLRIHGEEILITEGSGDTEWGCYPMAPWAGRVRNGQFEWAKTTQQLAINWPPHAIHGTVFDTAWEIMNASSLRANLGPGWPWSGEAHSIFELDANELVWRLEVHAASEPFPVVVGWHPWFRRSVGGGDGAQLVIKPGEMYIRDDAGIPTGARTTPTLGPWDDCFTSLQSPPRLRWPNGLNVELHSSCDHWVVYDIPEHALCIEPQSGPPNAFNIGGVEVARPGQPVCHTMRLRWWQDD